MSHIVVIDPWQKGTSSIYPRIEVDLAKGKIKRLSDGEYVFEWNPEEVRVVAGDSEVELILHFACAYAERPAEFDRCSDDYEQVHRDWWKQWGDMLCFAASRPYLSEEEEE